MPSISINHTFTKLRLPPSLYGIALAVAIALLANKLGNLFPLIGGPVIGILLGMLWRNTIGITDIFIPGIAFCSRKVLQWSIVFLGFGLSFTQVLQTGMSSLSVTLITLSVAFISAWLLGRALGIGGKLSALIGVGTAICGGSAIAAVSPIIKPENQDMAMSISVIFLFNIVAVLIFPPLGHALGLSDAGFGLWAGTAINDTSSVVAAGYSYSIAAGDIATIVKLTRATLIIPICLILIVWQVWRTKSDTNGVSFAKIFPWFILWFVLASVASSLNVIPVYLLDPLKQLAHFLIIVALTAIGLSSNLRQLIKAGLKPLALGLGVWFAVLSSSLIVQALIGTL